jgi:hypothetical protein
MASGLWSALAELPWVCRKRKVLPAGVQMLYETLRDAA